MDFRTYLLMTLIAHCSKHLAYTSRCPYTCMQKQAMQVEAYHRTIESALRHMEK